MNADKVSGDNQTRITKGISLTEAFTLIRQVSPSPLRLARSSHQRIPTESDHSSEHLLPQTPASPTSPSSLCVPHPSPPALPSTHHPQLTPPPPRSPSLSRSLPVASRLAVTHLAPPQAHNRRLVCEEGQEFRLG